MLSSCGRVVIASEVDLRPRKRSKRRSSGVYELSQVKSYYPAGTTVTRR